MYAFRYHRATSVEDAVEACAASDDGRFLGGGQTLLASLRLRLAQPDRLVDLGRIEGLRGIRVVPGTSVTIGAMTCHADVAESPEVRDALASLADLAGHIGDPMIRQMGTIGGSLANNDPAADYPAAVLGLDATIVTSKRRIAADDYFRGLFETALDPDEIITSVEFPVPRRAAYVKFRHPASRFALVGVFVAETAAGPRVAVTGAGPCVFRVPEMERLLARQFSPEAIDGVRIDESTMNSDLQATAAYRASLVSVIARRAIAAAIT